MSKEIRVGDLVIVTRGCGCWNGFIGTVQSFVNWVHELKCERCDLQFITTTPVVTFADWRKGQMYYAPTSWLTRIDPPALDETTDERQELTA